MTNGNFNVGYVSDTEVVVGTILQYLAGVESDSWSISIRLLQTPHQY
jgi:hypothetical protein